MPVTQTAATQVVDIVYGEAPRHYEPGELSAARRLLALPGMNLRKVSLLMAIVSSSRHWESIVVNVQKLELHLERLLDLLAKDPSAPGNRPLGGADGYQADTSEFSRESAQMIESTFAEKQAEVRRPWEDLWTEATTVHRLAGGEASRWCFREYNKRLRKPGESPRDFDKTMAAMGVATRPQASLPGRRSGVEPHRIADESAPKPAHREDAPRHWQEREEVEE